MSKSLVDNKRIAKNTLLLYIRMLLLMGISLFTVRVTLEALGLEDYGIYNVVGGVVSIFSFLKGALATSSQRYFSICLAKNDFQDLNRQFCLNMNVFLFIAVILVLFLETIGLWFLNSELTIAKDRMIAANIVYQLSIVAFVVQMISIPYNAMIVADEKMGAFAYISIAEGIMKLLIAYAIMVIPGDKLSIYGLLTLIFSLAITASYFYYCKKKLRGTCYHWYWNVNEVKELFGFTGWHFLGTTAVSLKAQGINILLNMFFNPTVNAARAVAFQIESALMQLSGNFFTAVKPQMYKAYTNKEMNALHLLVFRSTSICVFLMSIVSLPLITSADFVLSVWLKEVPQYAVLFTQLALWNGIIDSTNGSTIAPALATGRIRTYQIIVSFVIFLNIPLSYIMLSIGGDPSVTMYISIILSIITMIIRAYLLVNLLSFPFIQYLGLLVRLVLVTVITFIVLYYFFNESIIDIIGLLSCLLLSTTLLIIGYWFIILQKDERNKILVMIRSKINNK